MLRLRGTRCIILSTSLIVVSCASSPPADPDLPQRTFSSIALVSPSDIVITQTPETRTEKFKEGVGTGSATGTLGGMLVGATACGPYLYGLCVLGLGAAGLLAGGTAGALYGFDGISGRDARELEERMTELNRQSDLQARLVTLVKARVPEAMFTAPQDAEVQAILTIESVEFVRKSKEVYLESHVRLTFALNENRRVPEMGSRTFDGRSKAADMEAWLDPGMEVLTAGMEQNLDDIADSVAETLKEHWSPN